MNSIPNGDLNPEIRRRDNARWKMPAWMKRYAPLFINTGREPTVRAIEEMYNGRTDPRINLPLSTLEACVKTQVGFLTILRENGALLSHTESERGEK